MSKKTELKVVKKADKRVAVAPQHQILDRKSVTPKGMATYLHKVLASYAPYLMPDFMRSLHEAVVAGDLTAMRLHAELYGLTQGRGGLVVNVNQQNNNTAVASGRDVGFDSFVRDLHASREAAQRTIETTAVR